MRCVIQRVSEASVSVGGAVIGETGPGLMILVCAMSGDDTAEAESLAVKIAKLRIFRDEEGRMNRSVCDVGGSALVVSQFTLAADTSRGNRPGFSSAASPDDGDVEDFIVAQGSASHFSPAGCSVTSRSSTKWVAETCLFIST